MRKRSNTNIQLFIIRSYSRESEHSVGIDPFGGVRFLVGRAEWVVVVCGKGRGTKRTGAQSV